MKPLIIVAVYIIVAIGFFIYWSRQPNWFGHEPREEAMNDFLSAIFWPIGLPFMLIDWLESLVAWIHLKVKGKTKEQNSE